MAGADRQAQPLAGSLLAQTLGMTVGNFHERGSAVRTDRVVGET